MLNKAQKLTYILQNNQDLIKHKKISKEYNKALTWVDPASLSTSFLQNATSTNWRFLWKNHTFNHEKTVEKDDQKYI